jgi:hypothetical protein
MALKIGKLEIGLRLLISLAAIAIAYGYLGSSIYTLFRSYNYLATGLLSLLAAASVFAIPQSLGGLLAAIASLLILYWQSNLTSTLIAAITCLTLYILGFQDVRYDPEPEKKLSIIEIVATVITLAFTATVTLIILQNPINWLTSILIGAIAGAITLVGKQLSYIDLSQKTIWRSLGILNGISLAIGFALRATGYITTKPIDFL